MAALLGSSTFKAVAAWGEGEELRWSSSGVVRGPLLPSGSQRDGLGATSHWWLHLRGYCIQRLLDLGTQKQKIPKQHASKAVVASLESPPESVHQSLLVVSCLCGSAPCLLCGCCPSTKNSTITRLSFTLFLFLGTLVSIIMIIPGVEAELHKLPGFCEGGGTFLGAQGKVNCKSFLGHKSVYRMCFALAVFYFLFALMMICVRSSKDPRAAIQNGFWFFKFLILVGITVGAFYIPDGSFTSVWFYFGVLGSFFFILIQLILLIDFAHSWSQIWLRNADEGNSKSWYAALFIFTFLFYVVSIAAVVLLYVYYTKPDSCTENKAFISVNLIFCVIVSVVSILPKVQDAQPHSGLLQASIITLYTMFVTWSALANVPTPPVGQSVIYSTRGQQGKRGKLHGTRVLQHLSATPPPTSLFCFTPCDGGTVFSGAQAP
ncbi:Serine incorporator 2 [Varanus komodoensis]|nr:Serine incorporator 2 [Varanus komodoensis]